MSAKTKVSGVAATTRIPDKIRIRMKETIAAHAGCEVLFVAELGADNQVSAIFDIAHGSVGMACQG